MIVHRIASDNDFTIVSIGCPEDQSSQEPEPPSLPAYEFSSSTYLQFGNTIPGENPKTDSVSGLLTINDNPATFKVTASKSFNYANTAAATLSVAGNGSITATALPNDPTEQSAQSLTLQPGTYNYTLTGELTIESGLTYGQMSAIILAV